MLCLMQGWRVIHPCWLTERPSGANKQDAPSIVTFRKHAKLTRCQVEPKLDRSTGPVNLKGWNWLQVSGSAVVGSGSDVSLLTWAVWDTWPPEVCTGYDEWPRVWSSKLTLMMQRDTPREGGRRAGSSAWTRADPRAKRKLLQKADWPAEEETLSTQHRWVRGTCESVSNLIEWKDSCPSGSFPRLLGVFIWIQNMCVSVCWRGMRAHSSACRHADI